MALDCGDLSGDMFLSIKMEIPFMELILHIRAKLRDWALRLRNLCFQISIKVSIYLLTVNLSRLL